MIRSHSLPLNMIVQFRRNFVGGQNEAFTTKMTNFENSRRCMSLIVRCDKGFSSEYISSCGVPHGCVLSPLLFIMYTTPQPSLLFTYSKPPPLRRRYSTFSYYILVSLTKVPPTSKLLCNRFPPECPQVFLLLPLRVESLPRLNFSLLVSKRNIL